jgi:3-phosphoshikimate 1-carboxyvinyltransferase
VKESDRLAAVASGLRAMGVEVSELPDGLAIRGGRPRRPQKLLSGGDHRMAMAWAVATLAAGEPCEIEGADVVDVSYPGFFRDLDRLAA